MGQYYKPVSLETGEWVYSHKQDNGLKLMEHSYIGNRLMTVVERLLSPEGAWYKHRIVWAGDYADTEKYKFGDKHLDTTLYSLCREDMELSEKLKTIYPDTATPDAPIERDKTLKYLVNHTIKHYVDLDKVVAQKDGWTIHPLSLLTCEGNGRGGWDFHGHDDRIGTWARHSISMEREISAWAEPLGYKELSISFKETR